MPRGLWQIERPLILASGSAARRGLLEAAAVPLLVVPAQIDERELEAPLRSRGAMPVDIAGFLAAAKAKAVSAAYPDDLVLGADQTLAIGSRVLTKPADAAESRSSLQALSGRTHTLHSAWCLARDGRTLTSGVEAARLTMRQLGPAFLDRYIEHEGSLLLASVGAYRLEGPGVQLFERIEGDQSTILGLPLLPVLAALRQLGYLLG